MSDVLDDYLEHHGVKGMKWGQRKVKAIKSAHKSTVASKQRERSWGKKYKKRATMSDAQLKKAVQRLQLENEFNRQATLASSASRAKAKKRIQLLSDVAVKTGATSAVKDAVTSYAKKAAVAAVV